MIHYIEQLFQTILQYLTNIILAIIAFFHPSTLYHSTKTVSWKPNLYEIDYTYSKEEYDRTRYRPIHYFTF